jgi:hypothetical protein
MRLIGAVLAASLTIATLAPPTARADADPPSDVLLVQSVFYPYQPPVPTALERTLNAEVAAAAHAHFPIKVALIASPIDLGAIPQLFGQPQRYAAFLEQEISFGGPQRLLVVMTAGYGVSGLTPAATAAVRSLAKPASTAGLTQAAIEAVRRLAAASGHPLPGNVTASSGSGGGSNRVLIIGVVVLACVAIASAVIAVRNRPRR